MNGRSLIFKALVFTGMIWLFASPDFLIGQEMAIDANESKNASAQKLEQELQAALNSIYKAHPDSVGLMVHVEAPEQGVSWSGAVGYSDKEQKTALDPTQPALIASNVKTYVSAAILRLVEDKKIATDQAIKDLISETSAKQLVDDGYDLSVIKVSHLLSHTSGIHDYIDDNYLPFTKANPKHRWTREEQIALSVKIGEPLGAPGDVFSYADVNFLLLGEILEHETGKPFFTAVRELVGYEKHGLDETWFMTLEESPASAKPLVHQYFTSGGLDSYEVDPSFDLYGAGGIAATTRDLAEFSQALFNGKVITDKEAFEQIFTPAKTKDEVDHHYHFGLSSSKINGFQAYGHGGFWGTVVQYFPNLNASVSVFVLERDERILRKDILEAIVNVVGDAAIRAEEEKVIAVINNYIVGTAYNHPDKLRAAFLPQANMFLDHNDKPLFVMKIEEYADRVARSEAGVFNGRVTNILNLEVFEGIATAKLEVIIPSFKKRFIDMLLLKKLDDGWKIISKTAASEASDSQGEKVLLVVSNVAVQGDSGLPAGNSFAGLVTAFDGYQKAGFHVDVVSPLGGEVSLEQIDPADELQRKYLFDADFMYAIGHTSKPSDVNPDDYGIVQFTDGSASVFDIPQNGGIQKIAMHIYEKNSGIIAAVGHGTSALVNLKTADGRFLIEGKGVSGLPDKPENDSLSKYQHFPFMIQRTLIERGGELKHSETLKSHVEVDGNLITGQDLSASEALTKQSIELLRESSKK